MGNKHTRETGRILQISNAVKKRRGKRKELNVFMVGLDGAGKSTILYKHLANDLYSSTDSMRIPPTITYNREQIKPRKKPPPSNSPPSKPNHKRIHTRHSSANNLPVPVGNLNHSKSKSYTYRQYNHNRKQVPVSVTDNLSNPIPPRPQLQSHNSQPVPVLSKQRQKYRNRYHHPMPINPVQAPLSNMCIPQIHPHLQMHAIPTIPRFSPPQTNHMHHSHHSRSQSQRIPDLHTNITSYHSNIHHYQSRSQGIPVPIPIPTPTPHPMQSMKPLPSDDVILNVYDFGGNVSTRKLWTNYKQNVPQLRKSKDNDIDFIILVIDCADSQRLNDENYDCIQVAMKDLLNNKSNQKIPMVIFGNKQDLPNAVSIDILPYRLGLKRVEIYELIGIIKECRNEYDNSSSDLVLPWKVSSVIVGYLPDEDTHWMMSKRHWMVFGSCGITEGDKGVKDGLKWLYDEYNHQFGKKNKNGNSPKRKLSFAERFRFTM